MKNFALLLFTLLSFSPLLAQHILQGKITDQSTGEPLPGAHIVLENTALAFFTNQAGEFNIRVNRPGNYMVRVSYVGYETSRQLINIENQGERNISLLRKPVHSDEVIVTATRADQNTPTTFENIDREEIERMNVGQEIPYILRMTPSLTTSSDAGLGVGYAHLRLRGIDQTGINVTINGIPLNDSESQGVWWVNMPDFASSLENIQIQRGLGTSTHGAGAFGGSINLQTTTLSLQPYGELDNSLGSFNTRRHSARFGTGLINNRFSFDGRLSKITSDGFIDRASADLRSWYLSGAYYGNNNMLKAIAFSGREATYQAWWGVPEAFIRVDSLRTFNLSTYENEVDNYGQDHYQLHYSHDFGPMLNLNAALHYTHGRGYYEQFQANDLFSNYNLPNIEIGDTLITQTDIVRRKWLDNDFYGMTFSADIIPSNVVSLIIGGGANHYTGDHFGEVIWARHALNHDIRHRYYEKQGNKTDVNIFTKINYHLTEKLNVFGDIQYRRIDYSIEGIDENLAAHDLEMDYNFINPKVGLGYSFNPNNQVYGFLGIGNREPTRYDFVNAVGDSRPEHETLFNAELGYSLQQVRYSISTNLFYMGYQNQLVMTGELNEVGIPVRTNVPESYRMGVEFTGGFKISPSIRWNANLALSENRIKDFTETIIVLDENFAFAGIEQIKHGHAPISLSPSITSASEFTVIPLENFEVSLLSRYVGRQFLDNTGSEERSIDPYFVNDLRLGYTLRDFFIREATINLFFNNILNEQYETFGYTFGWLVSDNSDRVRVNNNFYYPQAGLNVMGSLVLRF